MTQQDRIPLEEIIMCCRVGELGSAYNNVVAVFCANHIEADELKAQILQDAKIVDEIRKRIEYLKQHGNNIFDSKYVRDVMQELQQLLGEKE